MPFCIQASRGWLEIQAAWPSRLGGCLKIPFHFASSLGSIGLGAADWLEPFAVSSVSGCRSKAQAMPARGA